MKAAQSVEKLDCFNFLSHEEGHPVVCSLLQLFFPSPLPDPFIPGAGAPQSRPAAEPMDLEIRNETEFNDWADQFGSTDLNSDAADDTSVAREGLCDETPWPVASAVVLVDYNNLVTNAHLARVLLPFVPGN